ncbi:MAG: glycerol-3-phosphate dehydrogenase/oxidase [Bradymonadales bacterium]|nr:MAG: glycerol-3-phosphate dehydrogenase/oxidase [Bradymonadales bacterium]
MTELLSPRFSFRERESLLDRAKAEDWDVVIIGGGATGAACVRDAALRGLRACLLEAEDFASGTSSGSTKLVHGGIRYLQNFEFKLVFEAIRERELLEKLYAPLIKKLSFLFPTYRGRAPSKHLLRTGLLLYDSFSRFKERHRAYSSREAQEKFPWLNPQDLSGVMQYSDSFTEDFRLVIEMIKSAQRLGAVCLSRARVSGLEAKTAKGYFQLRVDDSFSQKSFKIGTKAVINCAGPFSDEVKAELRLPPRLHLTQGVHFVAERSKLPLNEAVVLPDPDLNRILFAIPWNDITYLGTTDTKIRDVKEAQAQTEDLEYVLKIANRYFLNKIEPSDIFQSWAAVRPLIRPEKELSNSKISREHQIEESSKAFFHILGGKLTSHRLMAQEALDMVCNRLQRREKSSTLKVPLQALEINPPSERDSEDEALFFRYGVFAHDVLSYDQDRQLGKERLLADRRTLTAEALYAIHHEMALCPLDFLRRRSSLYYETGDLKAAKRLIQIFQEELQWSPTESANALNRVQRSYEWDQKALKKVP